MSAIICRGVERPVRFPVHTWFETGWHFTCRTRSLTRAIVNHWTAAENPPERVYENLRAHKNGQSMPEPLSVHFCVDQLGEVYQFADTEARCAHCKAHGANGWSIGIEFVCRGDNFEASQRAFVRQRSQHIIHGVVTAYDDLLPAQIATGIRLNEALCEEYGLPLRVPTKGDDVYSTELPAPYIANFTGCLAHYLLERKKRDPGITLMRALHQRELERDRGGAA